MTNRGKYVITSYSIHYTKLYEILYNIFNYNDIIYLNFEICRLNHDILYVKVEKYNVIQKFLYFMTYCFYSYDKMIENHILAL